jgi:UDP-N-acetylglucosamine--N-acetylmuramyl-(pentapeptide) pyrophosphoryl-undecaprenol N-acetylglucosamine transferase
MGGYVSGPGGAAAWLLRKPLLIQEQNAVAGTTNRLLAPLARTIVAGFPGAFPGGVEYRVLGNPVRRELLAAGENLHYDFSGQRALRLLVLGGSLGARPLNELVPAALGELISQVGNDAIEVWHQTGEAHLQSVRVAYSALPGIRARSRDFIDDMVEAYRWADLVFCRAGALTVSELAIMGRPSLLVPLPHAIDDHQSANARYLAEAGAAQLLRQDELDSAALAAVIRDLLGDPGRLQAMAQAARSMARPDATAAVSDCCEVLINAG